MKTRGYNQGMKKKIGDLFLLPTGDGRVILITKIEARKCNICGKVFKTNELVAHQKTHGSISANYQVIHLPFMSPSIKFNVFSDDEQLFPCQVKHENVKLATPFTTISSTANDEASLSRKSSDNQIALGNVKMRSRTPTPLVSWSPSLKLFNSNQLFKRNPESKLFNTLTFVSSSSCGKVGSGSQGTDQKKNPENTKQIGGGEDSTEIQKIDHKEGRKGPHPCVSLLTGNSVEEHRCSICSKVFSSRKCIEEHVKSHSVERPFKCDLCNKSFKKSFALSNHKRYHSAVKNYKCNVCNYSCTYKAHLMSHQKRHFNQYSLQCDTCNNGFHTKQEMEEHCNSQHTGKKPYTCDKSKKTFPSRKNRMNRKSALHEEKVKECEVICKER